MKKLMICLVLMCVLLTACNQAAPLYVLNSSSTVSTQTTTPSTAITTTTNDAATAFTTAPTTANTVVTIQSTILPTTSPTTVPAPTVATTESTKASTVPPTIVTTPTTAGMTPKQVGIYDYQQYLSYIENSDLPKFFVTYDALSPIGEFRGFSIQQRYIDDGSYEWYRYSFNNETGYRFGVSVIHNQEQNLTAKEYIFGLSGDLRKIDKTSSNAMYYLQDGVTYKYNMYGLLSYIEWTYNDTTYKLHGEAMMFDFPHEGIPAFVANLLHTDTVEAAMQSFKASMESAAVK